MNTFILHDDPRECARLLDYKRLGKQRLECVQLLRAIERRSQNIKAGWINHPATIMWIGFEKELKYYTNCMINEWVARGFKNTIPLFDVEKLEMPDWFKWPQLQLSHRASLLRKDLSYYGGIFQVPEIYLSYTYIWPNENNRRDYRPDMTIDCLAVLFKWKK